MAREKDPTEPIRKKASKFPAVAEGTSCTQSSFKAGKGYKAMFKLERSMPQAKKLAEKQGGKHGGEYLTRSANITNIEGEAPDTTVIPLLKFPSMEAVQAFMAAPAYAPHMKARQAGSVSNFHVIDDTDVAGTIPYLPKG